MNRSNEPKLGNAEHIDPVCRMRVRENSIAGTSNHGGEMYYFCSMQCKDQFDRHPEQLANAMIEKAIG